MVFAEAFDRVVQNALLFEFRDGFDLQTVEKKSRARGLELVSSVL